MSKAIDIFVTGLVLALVLTTLVLPGRTTAADLNAGGTAIAGAERAAIGG